MEYVSVYLFIITLQVFVLIFIVVPELRKEVASLQSAIKTLSCKIPKPVTQDEISDAVYRALNKFKHLHSG